LKFRLVLISVLTTSAILLVFSFYFYFNASSLFVGNKEEQISKTVSASVSQIQEFIIERVSDIDLMRQLSLVRLSLEFSRTTRIESFIDSYENKYSHFKKIIILDENKNYFIPSDIKISPTQLNETGKILITYLNGDIHISSAILQAQKVTGYIIGIIPRSYLESKLLELSEANKVYKGNSYLDRKNNVAKNIYESCFDIDHKKVYNKNIFPDVCYGTDRSLLESEVKSFTYILVITFLISVAIYIVVINGYFNSIMDKFNLLLRKFSMMAEGDFEEVEIKTDVYEFKKMNELSNEILMKLKDYQKIEKRRVRIELRDLINRQIAHDIRSPLEALKSIANNLDSLDYNTKRIVTNSIGRISDIANGLLKTGKEEQKEFMPGSLGILIDDIISDKSFERDATINYESKITYKDTYMLGNENQLYRAISNIINNGIEAQDSDAKIDIELDNLNGELILSVKDYGKGMDEQTALKVLDGGYTTKEKGNGLGLSYAKKVMEEHGGNLVLNTKLGQGTEIKISLPSIEAPRWLVDQLKVEESAQKIVCVDDDPSFLELYKDKFKEFGIEVITYTEKEIEKTLNVENAQYYFDYDLGNEHSGLDFIIENGLANKSTLVTSMHQDEDIQKRCIENGIKILPKQMFNKASVKFEKMCRETAITKQYILIDDDDLMHMTWKMEADKKAIEFKAYSSVEEFIKDADQYSKNTVIYVDSNLADGLKGEIESQKISQLGFTEIYLATGFSADDLEKPEWIREIVGKRPEFK
jgi:signal transduction histidine kinase